MDLFDGLNDAQQRAICAPDGPVLVLAGPGSGKTRVLTHRVAWLVQERHVAPWRVMAMTFTNKAAREMRQRLEKLLGPTDAGQLMLGTFHALCARILRREAENVGMARDYVIYDTDDQLSTVKQALKQLNVDDKRYRPQTMLGAISKAKNELIPPERYEAGSYVGEVVRRVYERYQAILSANNAVDFDDLLMVTAQIFARNPEILARYQQRYLHVLVDEFQDTNMAQYVLLRQLSGQYHNLFCVADEDQCVTGDTQIATREGAQPIAELDAQATLRVAAGRGAVLETAGWERRSRHYDGRVVKIVTRGGRSLTLTPNHVVFARLGERADGFYVYLMHKRDVGYRIGLVKSVRRDGIYDAPVTGLAVRGNQEKADKVWILKVCSTKAEALFWEQYFAFEYGIPTTVFFTAGRSMEMNQDYIDDLYRQIDTQGRAERLMSDWSISPDHPHHRPKGIVGDRQPSRITIQVRMFGDSRRSDTSPWHAHRVYLNTSDPVLEQVMMQQGYNPRPARRGTWKLGWSNLDYGSALRLAENIARAGDGLEIACSAFLTTTQTPGGATRKFDLHPASHLHPGMVIPVEVDGRVEDDEIVQVDWEAYSGPVYDLDVAKVHTYTANGIVVHNSIYRWRGADYRNIARLRKEHPELETVLLEQNYRSTQNILDAAQAVIRHNRDRTPKSLFTRRGQGLKISVREAYDQDEEARQIVETITRLVQAGEANSGDFAVMYRTNAQSRAIEEAFLRAGLPYKLVGATRFYGRREIKDLIAYLRVIHNPSDGVSLARIINVPPRGIGATTMAALESAAQQHDRSVFETLRTLPAERGKFSGRAYAALVSFLDMVEGWIGARADLPVAGLIDRVLQDSGYGDYIRDGTEEGEDRWANVLELRAVAAEYASLTLTDFLADVALVSDVDNLSEEVNAPSLLTLHSAKGLEFPIVFITGLEEGILPHSRSLEDEDELAEERRLMYVGITRARDRLYLSYAFRRAWRGSSEPTTPSRFLGDLPADVLTGTVAATRGTSRRAATTWASTPTPPPPPLSGDARFRAGQHVQHPTFGRGMVVEVRKQGTEEIVGVYFERGGLKRILADYLTLA